MPAPAAVYFKDEVRAVGLSGGAPVVSTDAAGNRTWTTTVNGATAAVKWKDRTIDDQPHTLKAGSTITKLAAGGYEIAEAP